MKFVFPQSRNFSPQVFVEPLSLKVQFAVQLTLWFAQTREDAFAKHNNIREKEEKTKRNALSEPRKRDLGQLGQTTALRGSRPGVLQPVKARNQASRGPGNRVQERRR